MKVCFRIAVAFLVTASLFVVGTAQAQDRMVGHITISSLERLVKANTEIAAAAENQGMAFGAALVAQQVLSPPFSAGVDITRPVSVVAWINDDMEKPDAFALIPYKNLEMLQKVLPLNTRIEEAGENAWTINDSSYAVAKDGWIIVAKSKDNLPKNFCCESARKVLDADAATLDVSARLFINSIPEKQRREALAEAVGDLRRAIDQHARCLGPALAAAAQKELDNLLASAERNNYVSPLESIQFGLKWNSDKKTLLAIEEFEAQTGSRLLREITQATTPRASKLAGFRDADATFSFGVNTFVPLLNDPVFGESHDYQIGKLEEVVRHKVKDPEQLEKILGFIEASSPVWKACKFNSTIDGSGNLYLKPDCALLTLARRVPDGYALEGQFGDVRAYLNEYKKQECEKRFSDYAYSEDGDLHIYSLNVVIDDSCCKRKPCCDALQKHFEGKLPICLVYDKEMVYFAVGTGAKDRLLALIKCAKEDTQPALGAQISLMDVLWLGAIHEKNEEQKASLEKALETLRDNGRGEVTLTLVPTDKGARWELEISTSAIRMLKAAN
ncbi:MAG: hypothetical protein Q4D38_11015 [Planctomycetia bacterium]|nr:hypothetical protein [Planctomycetia bacterium]